MKRKKRRGRDGKAMGAARDNHGGGGADLTGIKERKIKLFPD